MFLCVLVFGVRICVYSTTTINLQKVDCTFNIHISTKYDDDDDDDDDEHISFRKVNTSIENLRKKL